MSFHRSWSRQLYSSSQRVRQVLVAQQIQLEPYKRIQRWNWNSWRFYSVSIHTNMTTTVSTRPEGTARYQLYNLATPNGQKVTIFLEELGVEYDYHLIDISKNDQFQQWFVDICPNSKIPTLVDKNGPNGQLNLFESGAILTYLAEQHKKFLAPEGTAQRYETLKWLFFQVGGVGPMFGQWGHFHKYAPEDIKYAKERYDKEVKRLLQVIDTQLSKHKYISGEEYTIADIASWPWVKLFSDGRIDFAVYPNVSRWIKEIAERPAVKKALERAR